MSTAASSFFNSLPSAANVFLGDLDAEGAHQPSVVNQLLLVIVAVVVFLILYQIIQMIIQQVQSDMEGKPYLYYGSKNAKTMVRIRQDPRKDGSIPLRRSLNEQDGLEFSYSWWTFIEDYEYKQGEWKNVFFKGNTSSWPSRAPGIWLAPYENTMHVYMNSYKDIQNEMVISNIPVSKWFHTTLIVEQDAMSVYINGYLKDRRVLNGIPKQNFGDVFINAFGGFSGYLSRLRYYDYAIPLSQVQVDVKTGPDMNLPYADQQKPPYLTPYWWVNSYNG